MKEFIRLQNVSTEGNPGKELENYNLSVFDGEILYLLGSADCGKEMLGEILTGRQRIASGVIYYEEDPLIIKRKEVKKTADLFREQTCRKMLREHIAELTQKTALVEDLSVMENLEMIRKVGFSLKYCKEEALRKQTSETLKNLGISASADTIVRDLPDIEKQILCMEKLIACGTRLLIWHSSQMVLQENARKRIQHYMRKKASEGISFLLMSETPDEMLEIADRVQIVIDGTDQMEYDGRECTRDQLYRILLRDRYAAGRAKGEKKMICLLDAHWESMHHWDSFFGVYRRENPEIWAKYLNMEVPGFETACAGSTVAIPYDSATRLFDHLSLEENLCACIRQRVHIGKSALLNRKAMHVLRQDFLKLIGYPGDTDTLSDLTFGQKKILSVFRWQLMHPKCMILEHPFWGMDVEDVGRMNAYLLSLKKENMKVIFYTSHLEPNVNCYDTLILSKAAKHAEMIG